MMFEGFFYLDSPKNSLFDHIRADFVNFFNLKFILVVRCTL
ncbi:hypothetical protein SAMN05660841_01145 [Sphingobacterium nematocida]|uniref:Uncharacterized protein n=1 Tax=Sphingobacterium nematocida TaxID=1513896 RepID=A0A1T5C5K4_9SPHI|nr:hypothetical protein SAMN05660841_01145 [Sphingobacterium nematocida]